MYSTAKISAISVRVRMMTDHIWQLSLVFSSFPSLPIIMPIASLASSISLSTSLSIRF